MALGLISDGLPYRNPNFMPNKGMGYGTSSPALSSQYSDYTAAAKQNASDYGNLMGNFNNLLQGLSQQQATPAPTYNAGQTNYNESPDTKTAIGNLGGLASTGGYSAQDIADLRARGVSPLRAVYANAQANINRQRSLSGGYSPGYTAATAKLARDQAQGISDATQNVNAGIAQDVAKNKLAASSAMAQEAGHQSDIANQIAQQNTQAQNQASQFNINTQLSKTMNLNDLSSKVLDSIRGLYGTTPGLTKQFGDTALQTADLESRNSQMGMNNFFNMMAMFGKQPSYTGRPSAV